MSSPETTNATAETNAAQTTDETTVDQTAENEQPEQTQESQGTVEKQPEIVVGSVVQGTTASLGAAADAEVVKKTLEQKPVMQQQDVSKFQKRLNDVKQSGSALAKTIVSTLESYVSTMAPGKINEENVIHRNQLQLWSVIKNTLENEEDFENNWKLLVSFFREYQKGALGGSAPFRGLDNIKSISKEQNQAFMNVLNLLIISGGLTNKKDVVKYTNLDKTISSIFKETVRQRIVNYYV